MDADGLRGAKSRRAYRQTCLALSKKPKQFWKDITEKTIIGSEEFVEKIKIKFAPLGRKKEEVVDYTRLARPAFDVDDELERVAEAFETEPGSLKQRSKYFPVRQAAFLHLVEDCGMRVGNVADYFGVSPSAVTKGIDRLKERSFDDIKLEKQIQKSNVKV